jgi:hypothetical protein
MSSSADESEAKRSAGLRRSVDEAAGRIQEIIDAAERVAAQIHSDAESEARSYLEARKREADALVEQRAETLDEVMSRVAETAEAFRRHADRMLGDIDRAIAEARSAAVRPASVSESAEEPRERHSSFDDPLPKLDFDLKPIEVEPPAVEPAEEPEPALEVAKPALVTAYPGRAERPPPAAPAAGGDQSSEALLRATQMAVSGKGRDEIAEALRSDFPGVEADSLLDQILS